MDPIVKKERDSPRQAFEIIRYSLLIGVLLISEPLAAQKESFGNLFQDRTPAKTNPSKAAKLPAKARSPKVVAKSKVISKNASTRKFRAKKRTSQRRAASGRPKELDRPKNPSFREEAVRKSVRAPGTLSRRELNELPKVQVYLDALATDNFEKNLDYLLGLKKNQLINFDSIVIFNLATAYSKVNVVKGFAEKLPKFGKAVSSIRKNVTASPSKEPKLPEFPSDEAYEKALDSMPVYRVMKKVKQAGFKPDRSKNVNSIAPGKLPVLRYEVGSGKREVVGVSNLQSVLDYNGKLASSGMGRSSIFEGRSIDKKKKKEKPIVGLVFKYQHYEDDLPFWLK